MKPLMPAQRAYHDPMTLRALLRDICIPECYVDGTLQTTDGPVTINTMHAFLARCAFAQPLYDAVIMLKNGDACHVVLVQLKSALVVNAATGKLPADSDARRAKVQQCLDSAAATAALLLGGSAPASVTVAIIAEKSVAKRFAVPAGVGLVCVDNDALGGLGPLMAMRRATFERAVRALLEAPSSSSSSSAAAAAAAAAAAI